MKERWNEAPSEVEALLHRDRYRRLHELLTSGRVEIRVVPKDRVFIHGKAGVMEAADGTKTCFLGSINETKSAFAQNYEILWEDSSREGVQWVEEEFDALWKDSYPLPDAIIQEIKRVADRLEIRFDEAKPAELPGAALAESPIYRGGEQLQAWQRSFVTMFLQHRETYGKTRLLLADEVGVGKTLSLAASAMISALLDDGPVLILCPSTLTEQWQVELADKLGIPSAVWSSTKKVWGYPNGHVIKTRGPEDIGRCPFRIAIVSTGLVFHDSEERQFLLKRKYGTVVLDEAHKARRRGGLGPKKEQNNNLLDFMLGIGSRTKNFCLALPRRFRLRFMNCGICCASSTRAPISSSGVSSAGGQTAIQRFPSSKARFPRMIKTHGNGSAIPCRPQTRTHYSPHCDCNWAYPTKAFSQIEVSVRSDFLNSK